MHLEKIIESLNLGQFRKDWETPINLAQLKEKYQIESNEDVDELKDLFSLKRLAIRRGEHENLDVDEFTAEFENGLSYKKLVEKFKIQSVDVCKIIRGELGLEKRPGGIQKRKEELEKIKEQIEELVSQGLSRKKIAKSLDTNPVTLDSWAARLGIKISKQKGSRKTRNEIVDILKKSDHAITTRELEEEHDLKITVNQTHSNYVTIEEKIDSYDLEKIRLELSVIDLEGYKQEEFFGEYNQQYIVFLPGMYDAALLKFFKILRKSNWFTKYLSDHRAGLPPSFNHNELKKILLIILNSMYGIEFLKDRIELLTKLFIDTSAKKKLQVKKTVNQVIEPLQKKIKEQYQSSVNNKSTENFVSTKSDAYESLLKLRGKKFFGRKFDAEQYWREFEQSDRDGKISKLKEIFVSMGFLIVEKTKEDCDFAIIGNKKIFVKIIDEEFSALESQIFDNEFENKGILVSFERINKNVLDLREKQISIEINDIRTIISHITYLPISEKSVVKIMYGKHVSEIVFVKKIDFLPQKVKVENIVSKESFETDLSVLKEYKDGNKIAKRKNEFGSVIVYLNELTGIEFLDEIEKDTNLVITSEDGQLPILGNVDGRTIKINLDKETKKDVTSEFNEPNRVFEEMINCSGLHWPEVSSKKQICNHMGLIFYHLWANEYELESTKDQNYWLSGENVTKIVGRDKKFVTESAILKFLRELYFRLKLAPEITSVETKTKKKTSLRNHLTKEEKMRVSRDP